MRPSDPFATGRHARIRREVDGCAAVPAEGREARGARRRSSKPEPFTIRLQMPDGYKIAPHTHPTDEHVTVLSGTFRAAMGTTWDDKALGDSRPAATRTWRQRCRITRTRRA